MRVTLSIDDGILAAACRRAEGERKTLSRFVEEAVGAALSGPVAASKPYRLRWKTHAGALLAGVDLGDRDSVFGAMEVKSRPKGRDSRGRRDAG